MPSDASIENYYNLCESGELRRQVDRIMHWILKHHNGRVITAHVVAQYTGMPIQTVSGRVSDLVKDGYLEQASVRIEDPVTGNPAHRVYPVFVQKTLC